MRFLGRNPGEALHPHYWQALTVGGGVNSAAPLVRAAKDKARQHRAIKEPLLLAINDLADVPSDPIDISIALFGWEQSAEKGISRITPPSEGLRKKSIWGRNEYPVISAILLFHGLVRDSIPYADVCLYENPQARHPIPNWLKQAVPHANVEEKMGIQFLRWPSEQRLSSVLGIPPQPRPYAELERKLNESTTGIFRRSRAGGEVAG